MSRPTQNALEITKKWFLHNGNVSLEHMNMTYPQKYRAKLVYELYNLWLSDKFIDLLETAKRISSRDYAQLLSQSVNANGCTPPDIQELSKKYVEALKIKPGVGRSYNELNNDLYTLNYISEQFNHVYPAIEKAKTAAAYDWVIKEGQKMGDLKAVKSAADSIREMNNNFDDKKDAASQIPNPHINITGDVTVIKPDNRNLTEEELEKIYKKYGLSRQDIIEMRENGEGVFEPIEPGKDKEQ